MDSKNLAIGILSTTAVVLFVGLMLVSTRPTPVSASGQVDRGGDYVVASGSLWQREELLYVIDAQLNRMVTYKFDIDRNVIEVGSGMELDQYLKGPQQQQTPPAQRQPPRRKP